MTEIRFSACSSPVRSALADRTLESSPPTQTQPAIPDVTTMVKATPEQYELAMRRPQLSHLLPAQAFDADSHLFLLNYDLPGQGTVEEQTYLGFGFAVPPLTGISEQTLNKIEGVLSLDLPTDSFVQWMLFASPDLAAFTRATRELRDPPSATFSVSREQSEAAVSHDDGMDRELFDSVFEGRMAQLERATAQGLGGIQPQRAVDYQIHLFVKVPVGNGGVPSETEIEAVRELRMQFESTVQNTFVGRVKAHDGNSYIRLMQTLISWQPSAEWRQRDDLYDAHSLIREQVPDFDNTIEVDEHHVRVNDRVVRTLSMKRLPTSASLWEMRRLLGSVDGARGPSTNILVSLVCHYPDQTKRRAGLERARAVNQHQLNVGLGKLVEGIRQKGDSFKLLFDELAEGAKLVHVWPAIALFCDDADSAVREASNFVNYAKELAIDLQPDTALHFATLLNHLPLCADPRTSARNFFGRYRTLASSNLAQLLPVVAEWKGTGTPVLTYYSRNMQPIGVDFWDSPTNYNAAVIAGSGGGKSFMINDVIMNYGALGAVCRIIDIGGSYRKLCQALNGDYIQFGPNSDICINPFPLVEDWDEECALLVNLVISMATQRDQVSDFQYASLLALMTDLYDEYGKGLTIDAIAERCIADGDQRVRDIGIQLFSFTSKGIYGRFFNGPPTLDFTKQLTVLELEELKAQPHLQQVVLLMLMYRIQQELYLGDRRIKKILVLDEAWDLLTAGDTAKFMETAYRRIRKYNGSAITITQSYQDLYRNEAGKAIAANCAFTIFLQQELDIVKALSRADNVALDEWAISMLKSVSMRKGAFSEAFWKTPYGQGVTRLIVPRFEQLLYSTKGEEAEGIEQLRRSGLSTVEAINAYMHQEASAPQRRAA